MATILAYGSPALGHLLPVSALLRELAGRGHDVHLRTLADGVPIAERLGLQAAAVDPRIEAITGRDWTARSVFGVLNMTIDVLCRRAELEVDDLARAIAEVKPDALILDANCWGAMSAADAGDLPVGGVLPVHPVSCARAGCRPSARACGRGRAWWARCATWCCGRWSGR